MMKIAILGGSSPFTCSLIDALSARADFIAPKKVFLFGRNERALRSLVAYGEAQLSLKGWTWDSGTELSAAVDAAAVVVQQIRFEGFAGRADDEAMAQALGLAADETLGPAAVRRALRSAPQLRTLGAQLAQVAPTATVLNLTNPLSLSTSILAGEGVSNCIGICELPRTTAHAAARAMGTAPESAVSFQSIGFNHRSFITRVEVEGQEIFPRCLEGNDWNSPADTSPLGFPSSLMRQLQAIPTKYFSLVQNPTQLPPLRAKHVEAVRKHILGELMACPTTRPPSLALRVTDWYEEAVVPLLEALEGAEQQSLCVNLADKNGLVREGQGLVNAHGAQLCPLPDSSPALDQWLYTFEAHEKALLQLVHEPTREALEQALLLDPLIPVEQRARAFTALAPELTYAPNAEARSQ